jgi:PAS domain-containing protein
VDSNPPLVRIAVVQLSGKSAPGVVDSSSGEGAAGSSATSSTEATQTDEGQLDDTLQALQRLGDEVDLEVFQDADSCVACVAAGVVDLVVLDSPLAGAALGLLDTLQAGGPPAIVVIREEGNDAALEAFRRGAADCVRVGADYARVLPEMALEQMQRWREALERQSAERRIRELQRYNENIIQNMNSALLVVGMDGEVGFANPRAGTILGADHDRRGPAARLELVE